MECPPSVLLIDDGELVRVRYVLERLEVSFAHRTGPAAEEGAPSPTHLLVTSARRANLVADLDAPEADAGPIWVCSHTQDFLPMRQRLKDLGFHYLIHSTLEREVLRLFFLRLLHRGSERRLEVRLPMQCELRYAFGKIRAKGRLEELSEGGCRMVWADEAAIGTPAVVYLPPELARGEELELTGSVAHCSPEAERSGGEGFSVIVVFRDLELEAQGQIQSILTGGDLGTRITPLQSLPQLPFEAPILELGPEAELPASEGASPQDPGRRAHDRRQYERTLTALQADASDALLGRDLSMTGIFVQRNSALSVGARVSIALYPGEREEPMIFEADVIREDQEGFGLRFVSMSPEQKLGLERMLERLPPLQSLADDAPEGDPLVVSKLIRTDG